LDNRFISPVSLSELTRRWQAARQVMDANGLDALVMQNANDWLGGFVRWFTGVPASNAYPRAVLFPREGGMVVVEQGPFGGRREPGAEDAFDRGVAHVLTTPSYSSIGYTAEYDAALIADQLRSRGARRVGWVNPSGAYFGFGRALEAAHPGPYIDVTEAIDRLKAIKSAEEWGFIRQTTALQDAVIAEVTKFIRPGLCDFEVSAYAQYMSQVLGAEQGIYISSSSPAGQAAVFRPRHAQGRALAAGDAFALLVETNGPGGYYGEIARIFVLGTASKALRQAVSHAIDAQSHTLRLLRPGTSCADILRQHNAYMREHGFPEEKRLYSHGQGYDMVERPLIREDETMTIEESMVLAVHPGYITAEVNALVCDNYGIGPDGAGECLHLTPKGVIEVA
jgi:Xaa-Pro aminopeptidase